MHIKYDVDINGALENKELPFVVGVLADLSGQPDKPLPRVKERKFVEIDRDNFNQVLAGIEPRMDAVPAVGQHTEAILRALGRDEEAIAALRAAGAI